MNKHVFFTSADSFDEAGKVINTINQIDGASFEGGIHINGDFGMQPYSAGDEIVKWLYEGTIESLPKWLQERTRRFDTLVDKYLLWYREIENAKDDELVSDEYKALVESYKTDERDEKFVTALKITALRQTLHS
jgi:hypothetical protein